MFSSCDLDLYRMALIYKLDLDQGCRFNFVALCLENVRPWPWTRWLRYKLQAKIMENGV